MSDCIFCKIVDGNIPAKKVYEDNDMIAFHDIRPAAKVHILIIPKLHISSLLEVNDSHQELLGKMMAKVPVLAKELGLNDGFKTNINTGLAGGQEVFHLHVHVYGGGPASN
ncbi:histidine triad nucleotide-binding protein [Leeia sp. TBRC 13508]|uniref:Histidine triad nucleotide-binding protein n=1 Tax=Leeia speluncae TaxID=2884804 RepID=A0ABS8D6L8_9NEIS|nr:histidine triad nucleotide-binding protein [Leeia speluncae]MCB6183658.1 histidine triad nucleotide-binding protein [Leeia speluncae]